MLTENNAARQRGAIQINDATCKSCDIYRKIPFLKVNPQELLSLHNAVLIPSIAACFFFL